MNEKIKTVIFTVAVTAVFVFMVSGVNALLNDKIVANRTIARQKVILKLFGLYQADNKWPDSVIPQLFASATAKISLPEAPALECYRHSVGADKFFVLAFSGQGFWDNISGFIALDLDQGKISGLEFTQHGETPGLGGRISEPEFKARFKDKPIGSIRSDGLRLKIVAEGSATKPDEVDGITGATGTSNAVEKIINNTITSFIRLNEGGKL